MTTQKEVAISVKSLHKSFKLPHEQHSGIKQALINTFRRNRKKGYEMQYVLKGLDFEIKKGDFFGIVGRNGSGKSTLLKSLAGIYAPDKGAIQINGTLVPFIELGVGFNPELTGRDNVFLNGALLGFSRDEMEAMYDDIVKFAELDKFMDQKLKNYSSGMQVRLAFSIAIRADADILLLDEVLAVGDEAFQRKCYQYFAELKKNKKTVILVTHDMGSVKKYCNRAIMIHEGEIIAAGDPDEVANEYNLKNLTSETNVIGSASEESRKESVIDTFQVELLSGKRITQNDKVEINYTVQSTTDMEAKVVMDMYNVDDGYFLYCLGTPKKQLIAGQATTFAITFDISQFNNMNIVIHSSIRDANDEIFTFANGDNTPTFIIRRTDYKNNKPQAGAIYVDGKNAKVH